MSDKSFGDCPSRNIVKNPLLSTAVTGLSIEDLTHNAVLVPVAATQGLITRSDHQIDSTTNVQTLRHSEHEFTNFPSGDSNTNVFSPLTTLSAYPPPLDNPQPPQYDKQPETTMSTVSKASLKSDDDFDVNEYFARLQGTRYVSAPINSHPDQNANLAATEENLEEINLNDEKNNEVQQSLTADIAQNFSQLPTVLPHVASAVFSSFSNMLNYKSREQTPDERTSGYQAQEVPFRNPVPGYQGQNVAVDQPLMAEDVVKEVAPPPKEIPNSGSSNFRITTKKKYAQIPGLSSGTNFETSQKIELNPLTKNVKNYFVPSNDDNIFTEAVTTPAQENDNRITDHQQNLPKPQESYNIFHPTGETNPASDFPSSAFNIPREMEPKSFEERLPPPPPSTYEMQGANAPSTAIPPPPMFSTQRTGSHGSTGQTGKSVLPPSVARRIGSNHPVIKQQPMQTINTENIFVPTFDPMNYPVGTAQPIGTSFSDIHSQSSYSSQVLTEQPTSQSQDIQAAIPPPAQFTQQLPPGFTPPPSSVIAPPGKAPTRLPPQKLASPPSMVPPKIAAPPMFAATSLSQPPTMFVPPTATVDGSTNSGSESSITNIFSPTPASQAPGAIQPPNVGPTSFFTPAQPAKTAGDAPTFYSPRVQEQPGQALSSEPPKPLIEPPKATGAVNYRMNKKKPQYYSGPIEGVGSISNSIKPVIPSVDSGSFQGALFTPEQPNADTNAPSAMPFDLSKQTESVPLIPQYNVGNPVSVQPPAAFDISQPAPGYPHFDITHHIQNPDPQYNTAFDLSRPSTDNFDQQEELKESKGFGIIGSLKSKLSSIDINKIQHSVTTFFDPAYKDATGQEPAAPIAQQNAPYSNSSYEAQAAQTNLEIFMPNAQQNTQQQYGYDYQQQNAMFLNNEYYKYPNFQNQGQPFAGHCSNSNDYPSQTPHPNTYNTNAQRGYPDQNINTTMFQNVSTNQPKQATENTSARDNVYTEGPKTFKENQDFNAEKKMDENVARAGPEVARLVQSTTMIEERFTTFNLEDLGVQNPMEAPIARKAAAYGPVATEIAQGRTFISDSFKQEQEPIAMYNPNDVNLFKNKTEDNTGKQTGIFANKKFEDTQNVPSYDVQSKELFAQIKTNNEIMEDIQSKLFPVDKKEDKEKFNDEIKTHNLFSSPVIYEKKQEVPKDRLLDSLTKDDAPVLGVASVPLFGLSTMLAEKSKEFIPAELMTSLSEKNSSMSFFDHTQKLEDYGAKHADELSRHSSSFSFFENIGGTPTQEGNANDKNIEMVSGKSSASFFENVDVSSQENTPEHQAKEHEENANATENIDKENQEENASELSICETCREVNQPDDKDDDQDVTNQLIENITSPIQLSNAVETTLSEPSVPVPTSKEQVKIDAGQFDDISHITEETIDTINTQSATELNEDVVNDKMNSKYGWTESAIKEGYEVDLDKIGFYESNPRYFKQALDEEFKKHEEMLLKQMNAPSAPPAEEEDSKSDEAGKLDVHSIEQDANKDFPLFEEFVIEPSKDDDDDDRKSENELDSFTNRVEKYKKMDPPDDIDHQSLFYEIAPQPISMTSYFDTGNYAVEAHYRNTNTRPALTIPPGFEEEFKRRVALAKEREKLRDKMKTVPDTSTQTRTTSVATYCTSRIAPNYSKIQPIVPVGFNIEANITSLVDEQSEPLPDFPTPPILKKAFEKKAEDKERQDTKESIVKPEEKKLKLPPIPNVFDPKPIEKETKLPEHSLAPGFKLEEETPLPELLTAFSSKANKKLEVLPPFTAFVGSKQDENPVSILPPYVPFVASKAEEDSSSILPPYAPFNVSQPDEIPSYSAFSAKDADDNSVSMLPPYTPFATSKSEEKSVSILPPFAPFVSPKSEESVLPPYVAFASSKPDDKSKSILPPYEPFPTSKSEDPAMVLPPFAAFMTQKTEEKTESMRPPFAAFTSTKSEEDTATALPPFAAFTTQKPKEKSDPALPPFVAFTTPKSEEKQDSISLPPFALFTTPKSEEKTDSMAPFASITASKSEEKPAEPKLPDPINFFTDTASTDPPETFSRLASYFSSPPKTDHAKSFFELSQSQNHYRHASSEQKTKINELMQDLTSVKNLTVSKDQTIKHVNYFTVEYDCTIPEIKENKRETKKENNKVELADDIGYSDLDSVFRNCRHCAQLLETSYKVRKAVNENGEQGNVNTMNKLESPKSRDQGSVSVNFDGMTIQEEPNEGAAGLTENRPATEYTPVKHHWFYRVDIEDKSIWRGFSVTDSRALEAANVSSDLNENTLVPTDGGRYDVNIVGRLRIPVYWVDKPTNVRRCSWFYKGTTDARYVPYTEPVAEKLEEEYRHGMTTAEWHRRLVLPNGEVVVMHGPSVMVHFLHSDAFSTPPLFSFGKRVYRNPPKIKVSRDQPEKIDHLLLMVHGAGEFRSQKAKIQSSSRPRVVRRGHDESEIEDIEPSSIDHLLLLCHGVGSACDMRFRSVEEVVEDFRSTSLQLVQSHYRNSYDQGVVSRVEVLPVSWHSTLHSGETGVDCRLAQITLDSIPRLRSFTNETVLDVLFYTSPVYCQTILDTVCKELNRIYELFRQRNPNFTGGVSLGGHSLGSVILYDLLCHQSEQTASEASDTLPNKNYVAGPAGTGQPFVRYPSLKFAPDAMYALGSPIAIFECIRGVDSLGASFSLPTCKNFFNIFHPYDPIAYRIEPLINQKLRELKPQLIPHHKGRKRMHLELKDTMARVGADLKQKLLESLRSTWNKWKAAPPTDGQLEKVVEEELEKEQLTDDCKEELVKEIELSTPDMLGRLNGGRRVDYVLQEAPLEMINEYLFAMSSHVGYWESEDTMLLILREIYSALGVQPDSTVPQQNMTVQRTRTLGKDETIIVNATDCPSTSRGAI